jgi:HTH-type transcriptional regulator, cell division transcriptional repressor
MKFAENIRGRRKALGLTQDELSQMTGIAQTHISRYELGLSEPTSGNLLAIAEALQVSADWLLGRADYPPDLPHQYGELSELEQQIVREFRTKSPERQPTIIEIVRLAQ